MFSHWCRRAACTESGGKLVGISVIVARKNFVDRASRGSTAPMVDESVTLHFGKSQSINMASNSVWATLAFEEVRYGDGTNLWGLQIPSDLVSFVQSLRVEISAQQNSAGAAGNTAVYIDCVTIEFYWSSDVEGFF